MEPARKRTKTHAFASDAEAAAYVESVPLTRDVWFYLLTTNPELTVQDISRMCRVNKQLRELCASGHVWNSIFVRQFGQAALDAVRALLPDALLRLMTERVARQVLQQNPAETRELLYLHYSAQRPNLLYIQYVYDPAQKSYKLVFDYNLGAPHALMLKWSDRFLLPNFSVRDVSNYAPYSETTLYLYGPLAPEQLRRLIYEALHDGFVTRANAQGVRVEDVGCAMCPARARLTCGGCARAQYCSKGCARAHWELGRHSVNCANKGGA